MGEKDKGIEIWSETLRSALSTPGARIERRAFLQEQFSPQYPASVVEAIIEATAQRAGIPERVISDLADRAICTEDYGPTGYSLLTGIPGGIAALGTMPLDIMRFHVHALRIAQKLAYLYGWPDLFPPEELIDEEAVPILSLYLGSLYGVSAANAALARIARVLSLTEDTMRGVEMARAVKGVEDLESKVRAWFGAKLCKKTLPSFRAPLIPVHTSFIFQRTTALSVGSMGKRLKRYLKHLPTATIGKA